MLNMVAKLRKSASIALCALVFGAFIAADSDQLSPTPTSDATIKSPGPEAHD